MRIKCSIVCPECGKNLTFWGRKGNAQDFQCIYCKSELKLVPRKWNFLTIQLLSFSVFGLIVMAFAILLKYASYLNKSHLAATGVLLVGISVLAILVLVHTIFIASLTDIRRK